MMGTGLVRSRASYISPKYDVAKLHSVVGGKEQAWLGPDAEMLNVYKESSEYRPEEVLTPDHASAITTLSGNLAIISVTYEESR
jgi:hypothetical protein